MEGGPPIGLWSAYSIENKNKNRGGTCSIVRWPWGGGRPRDPSRRSDCGTPQARATRISINTRFACLLPVVGKVGRCCPTLNMVWLWSCTGSGLIVLWLVLGVRGGPYKARTQ